MTEPIRLQKAISAAGLMSRRAAEVLIADGRVAVDGTVAELGCRVDPESQLVTIDGKAVPVAPDRITYLVYKPVGVISTSSDTHGRPTVVELVPGEPRVWPVGRLDADSEGLLLVSNDGALTNFITHPRHGITKTYTALADGRMDHPSVRRLLDGVDLDDGPAKAVAAHIVDVHGDRTLIEIVMSEGRNREVRRMLDAIGFPVIRLVRTAIGGLVDKGLGPGEWRVLRYEEVTALYGLAQRLPDTLEAD